MPPSSGLKTSGDGQPQVLLSQELANADAALYTCPATTSVKIMNASLCNVSANAVQAYIGLLKAGQSLADSHRVVHAVWIAAGDTLPLADLLGGHVLGPGDEISGFASTAAAVAVVVSAVVFS